MALQSPFIQFGDTERQYTYFPSSILSLNRAIGDMRGMRGGVMAQFVAEPANGKTTLAYDYIAQAQRAGFLRTIDVQDGKKTRQVNAVFADVERTFDPDYAAVCGVDVARLLVLRTDYAEQSFELIEQALRAGIQLVVYDSIPATMPRSETERTIEEDARMAGAANLISRQCVRLLGLLDNANALMIVINQFRANISTMSRKEKKYYGPRALQYYSAIIVELARIKNAEGVTTVQATIAKNKQGAEGNITTFAMQHGRGLDVAGDILALALECGIISKAGAWYMWGDIKAQGLEQAKARFDIEEIRLSVLKCMPLTINGGTAAHDATNGS